MLQQKDRKENIKTISALVPRCSRLERAKSLEGGNGHNGIAVVALSNHTTLMYVVSLFDVSRGPLTRLLCSILSFSDRHINSSVHPNGEYHAVFSSSCKGCLSMAALFNNAYLVTRLFAHSLKFSFVFVSSLSQITERFNTVSFV